MTLFLDRILETVARVPAQAAILADGQVVTYRQLLALVNVAARRLHERGVKPGDVVGLGMGQSALHLVAFLALARLGAIALPQFSNLPFAQRVAALQRYGARWVVTDGAQPAAGPVPAVEMRDLHARGDEHGFGFTDFTPAPETPLRIALTSGTTARQKAFLHTHDDFSRRLVRRFRDDAAVPRAIAPLLHITSALQLACHTLVKGGTLVFPKGNEAKAFLAAIHEHAVSHVQLPPADVVALLTLLPEESPAFPSMRQLKIVGATPSVALVRLAAKKFTPHISVCYSITEVGMVATGDADTIERVPGAVGRLAPGARLEVLDEEGRVLGPGQRGEIRVAVEGMPRGYYGADAELPGFRDGWFYPGDHGHVSSDGFVFVEGRQDSLMNLGGHKVAPEFIESVLGDYPGAAEIAVYAVPDELSGLRVAAAVVSRGALDWKAFAAHARGQLGWSAPARYYRVASLPRNAMGKLERKGLADWIAAKGEPVTTE